MSGFEICSLFKTCLRCGNKLKNPEALSDGLRRLELLYEPQNVSRPRPNVVGKFHSHVTSFLYAIPKEDFTRNFHELYNCCQKRIENDRLRRNVNCFPDLGKNILCMNTFIVFYCHFIEIYCHLVSVERIDLIDRPIVRKDFKVHGVLTIQTSAHFQLNPTLLSRTSEDEVLVRCCLLRVVEPFFALR